MKHSQTLGSILALLLCVACFLPWASMKDGAITVSGFHAEGTDFGKPGMLNCVFGAVSTVLFMLPFIWAKRTNIFIAALNLAWTVRNYLLVGTCLMGECPVKLPGLYLLPLFSAGMLIMSFFPRVDVR